MCVCVCVIVHYVLCTQCIVCTHTHGLEEGPDQYTGVKNGDIIITYG